MAAEIPFSKGPYLLAAILCEKVLTDQDGVKSAIRIVDQVTQRGIGASPPKKMPPFSYQLFLLIKLIPGAARGPYPLRIVFRQPSRKNPRPLKLKVSFEGKERGVDVVVQLNIKLDREGLYRFDVYLGRVRLARVPLRVMYIAQVKQKPVGRKPDGR